MFGSCGMAIWIRRQVFSYLSCSTLSVQFADIVRSVTAGTSHIIVAPSTFFNLSCKYSQYLPVTCNPIYLHIVLLMLPATLLCLLVCFRWHKCCAPRNIMFCVFFCLKAYPVFSLCWLVHDVPLVITLAECLILGCRY
jgi:hypothetical protein